MHGYLLFGRVLSSRVVPPEEQHQTLWKGANQKFKVRPWRKLAKEQMEKVSRLQPCAIPEYVFQPKSKEQSAKSVHKKKALQKKKRKSTQAKLKVP